jgi:hypothetical protein
MKAVRKMTKSESQPKPNSTSSEQTDASARSDAILALGRKLVEELGLEDSVDTLGRWMAHYIADLIARVESTAGDEKQSAEKNCFDAILGLWKHRAELPDGKRPFEDLEPVVRAIESLDPEDDTPHYFRSARPPADEGKKKFETESWLEMVRGFDYSSKVLIGCCLAEAARAAVDKSKEWVKLAEAAGEEGGVHEIVVRRLLHSSGLRTEPDPDAETRRMLKDRIKRLDDFIKMAEAVADDFRGRLEALPPFNEDPDSTDNDDLLV